MARKTVYIVMTDEEQPVEFYFDSQARMTRTRTCSPPFGPGNRPTEFDDPERAANKARAADLEDFFVKQKVLEDDATPLTEIGF